jgi:predicted GTPase
MTENHNRINIILIGNTGAGKSQLGNSILQNEFFKVGHTFRSETPIKNDGFGKLNNLELRVIDTNGFSYTEDKDHKDDWKKIVDLFATDKSIDGIILVINFKETRKGQQYKDIIQKLKDIFGSEVLKQRLKIVFTNAEYGEEYDPEKEEIQTNEMINLIGDNIIGKNDMIFVNTHKNIIKKYKYIDKITNLIENFNKIKKEFGSMDNQKVEMKKKELEEKEKQEKEKKQRDKDANLIQLKTINKTIISRENMISNKKKEIEEYKRRLEGAKKGLIASSIFTPFTFGFSGFGIAHCQDEMKSYKESIKRLEEELKDCESEINKLRNEQKLIRKNLN